MRGMFLRFMYLDLAPGELECQYSAWRIIYISRVDGRRTRGVKGRLSSPLMNKAGRSHCRSSGEYGNCPISCIHNVSSVDTLSAKEQSIPPAHPSKS